LQYPLKETYFHVVNPTESSFFLVLQKKRVFTIASIALLFGLGLAAVNGFVAPYASQRRITFISLYYIAYSFAAMLTRLLGGSFVDRQGEDKIIPYALSLTGGGLLLMVLMKESRLLFFSGFMTGC